MKILYVDAITAKHAQNNVTGLLSAFQLFAKTDAFDSRTLTKISSPEAMNKTLTKICFKNNYDLIFFGKCESVFGSTIKNIKENTNSFIISFLGDFYWEPCPFKLDQNQHADLSLFSYFEKSILDKYQYKNVGFWTDGCNPTLDIDMNIHKEHDVIFMGNNYLKINNYLENYSFRYDLMKKIDENFNLVVYGNGWDLKNIHSWVTNKDKTIAVNKAKISIGVSAVDNAFLYLSWPRVFQTMACGTMHMTQYVPGLELLFTNHKDIVWFNTIEESVELLHHYLKNEEELKRISTFGKEKALTHSYVNRVKGIIDLKIKDGLFDYLS